MSSPADKSEAFLLPGRLALSIYALFLGLLIADAQIDKARLSMQIVYVQDLALPNFEGFSFPIVPAEGGTFSFQIECYTGLAWVLTSSCQADVFVERSLDLTNWWAWPGPGLQLTLAPGQSATNMLRDHEFFRARIGYDLPQVSTTTATAASTEGTGKF